MSSSKESFSSAPPPLMSAISPAEPLVLAEESPLPPPTSDHAMPVGAPAPAPSASPSGRTPSTSARGVDELLQEFMSTSSRNDERVANELRRMVGIDNTRLESARSDEPFVVSESPRSGKGGAPFERSARAADFFYANTPAPRMVGSIPSPPALDDDPVGPRPMRRSVYVLFAVIAVLTVGSITVLRLEPGFLSGRTSDVVEAERLAAVAAAASVAARNAAGPCRAALVVTDVPEGAEILVRSGVAPIDVERVPSGTRLEFVALSDGFAPRRGVVPQGASWDTLNGKPRFELPIQLEKAKAKPGSLDPRPPADPGKCRRWERCAGDRARRHQSAWRRSLDGRRWSPRGERSSRSPVGRRSSFWSPGRPKGSPSAAACGSMPPSLHRSPRRTRLPGTSARSKKASAAPARHRRQPCTSKTKRS